MHTLVVQSYREDAPAWLRRCLETARAWAALHRHDYEFIGDALFEHVPRRFRDAPPASLLPLTDLARLGVLRERLAQGYQRVVWIDADVLIFRPDEFRLPNSAGALLCREVWCWQDAQGQLHHRSGINNAVMLFERGHPLLDFLHHAATELFDHLKPEQIGPNAIGTEFLSRLGRLYPLKLLTQVACLSPLLVEALFTERQPDLLRQHAVQFGHPIHAVNLCRSLLQPEVRPYDSTHGLMPDQLLKLVEATIANRGEMLNHTA